jgi:hypothetical protein
MSGLAGLLIWQRIVRASYTINGRPMTDTERKEFDAKFDEMTRLMREAFKDFPRG